MGVLLIGATRADQGPSLDSEELLGMFRTYRQFFV